METKEFINEINKSIRLFRRSREQHKDPNDFLNWQGWKNDLHQTLGIIKDNEKNKIIKCIEEWKNDTRNSKIDTKEQNELVADELERLIKNLKDNTPEELLKKIYECR